MCYALVPYYCAKVKVYIYNARNVSALSELFCLKWDLMALFTFTDCASDDGRGRRRTAAELNSGEVTDTAKPPRSTDGRTDGRANHTGDRRTSTAANDVARTDPHTDKETRERINFTL